MQTSRKVVRVAAVAVLVLSALFLWRWLDGRHAGSLTLYGNVDIRQVDLAFRVGGRISAVLVDEGDSVAEGQALARLDADLLTADDL